MQYIFNYNGQQEILKTVGNDLTILTGQQKITQNFGEEEIIDSFKIKQHLKQEFDQEDKVYNWYTIQEHSHITSDAKATSKRAKKTEEISSIVFCLLCEQEQIDNVTAGEHIDQFSEWNWPIAYKANELRKYKDKLYRCISAHTSQEDWTPDVVPALWTNIADPAEEWPAWSQPIGAHDAYSEGAQVSHNGLHWRSTIDSNVYEPGIYGWIEVE